MLNKNAKVAIIIIGSELLDGRTLDRNSNYLATELKKLNLQISKTLVCDDVITDITASIKFCYDQGADLIITSGGMGPTTDDLTREAIASYFKIPLILNKDEQLKQVSRYEKLGRPYPKSNDKQACFPEGSEIIANNYGTAPSFFLEKDNQSIIPLPGIPSELKGIYQDELKEIISSRFSNQEIYQKTFTYFGVPESALNDELEKTSLSAGVEIIYQVSFPEIKIHLKTNSKEDLEKSAQSVSSQIYPKSIVSTNNQSLPEVVHALLIKEKLKLAVAESCTGGMLGSIITAIPGSSSYFLGGVISYSNQVKMNQLAVSKTELDQHGAVSEEIAISMARGVTQKLLADIGVGITGVAGPDGGTKEKPVGTVWIAVCYQDKTITKKIYLPIGREKTRQYACYQALDIVRSMLIVLN